jgi:hypothetical protein
MTGREQLRDQAAAEPERRAHRRIGVRLPAELRREGQGEALIVRTITQNVSTGGVYLELDSPDFHVGDRLHVELTVPPAEGVSPYPGRAVSDAEVIRVTPVPTTAPRLARRFGVAAHFLDRLHIHYAD